MTIEELSQLSDGWCPNLTEEQIMSDKNYCATILPWHEQPFRLISWLEMNYFSAAVFFSLGRLIGTLEDALEGLEGKIHETDAPHVLNTLNLLEEECSTIALKASSRAISRCTKKLESGSLTATSLRERIADIRECIGDELMEEVFLWIPQHRQSAYTQEDPYFGSEVVSKFPSARYDIEEAGKCFGCGRFTAAVIHAMRVLEKGLKALRLTLGIPGDDKKSWSRVLDQIEKEIKDRDSRVKQKGAWAIKRQFYSEAVSEFRHFKDAWRNHASHGRDTYDEERAEKIIAHTRHFMRHLSTRLKEKR